MLSFVVCSILGQLLVLWWARRHESTFARRYAWASLALEGVNLIVLVPLVPAFFALSPALYLIAFAVEWLVQAALVVLAIVMAVRAWWGTDVATGPLPTWLTDRLPDG
jgi:hypothetical protein